MYRLIVGFLLIVLTVSCSPVCEESEQSPVAGDAAVVNATASPVEGSDRAVDIFAQFNEHRIRFEKKLRRFFSNLQHSSDPESGVSPATTTIGSELIAPKPQPQPRR